MDLLAEPPLVPEREPAAAAAQLLAAQPVLLVAQAKPQRYSRSESARFSGAEGKQAFAPSDTKMPARPRQPASRSALGVLQLAYFSMRYGLVSCLQFGEFYKKIVPFGLAPVNAEKESPV